MRVYIIAVLIFVAQSAQAQTSVPDDSSSVEWLLDHLFKRGIGLQKPVLAKLRAHDTTLIPTLDSIMRNDDIRRRDAAAGVLVDIGLPALSSIRTALGDTGRLNWTMSEALEYWPLSDSSALVLLTSLYSDTSADVRSAVVRSVNMATRGGGPQVGRFILQALNDPHPKVRVAASSEAFYVTDSASRMDIASRLVHLTTDSSRNVRRDAVYTLGNIRLISVQAVPVIMERMRIDPDTEIRWLSARVLGWFGDSAVQAVPQLLKGLNDILPQVRLESLSALGSIGVGQLSPMLADSVINAINMRLAVMDQEVRMTAINALACLGRSAIPVLSAAIHSSDSLVVIHAVRALATFPDNPAIVQPLFEALQDSSAGVRKFAAYGLGGIGQPVIPRLKKLITSKSVNTKSAAGMALFVHSAVTELPVGNKCYKLEYGPWVPQADSANAEWIRPPSALRFSTVALPHGFGQDTLAFSVERQYNGKWYPSGFWVPRSKQRAIDIDPSPSLSGSRLHLEVSPPIELRGSIRTYWDYPHESETASVVAREVSCNGG